MLLHIAVRLLCRDNWGLELLDNRPGSPAGRAGAPGGVLLEKQLKPKPRGFSTPGTALASNRGRRIEDAYGESPPPRAFVEAPMWPNVEARPAKLSDHVFPESVWKAFGEHVGVLMVIVAVLEASWAIFRRSLGALGPSRAVGRPTKKETVTIRQTKP